MASGAIPTRELAGSFQQRYSNTGRSPQTDFSGGMIRDVTPFDMPANSVYDASDMVCDYVGKIRKRGGTTSPSSSNRTAVVENLLGFRSNGVDAVSGLYGSTGKASAIIYSLDRTTGAATSMGFFGGAAAVAGRPFQHFNYGVFPFTPVAQATTAPNGLGFIGGGTGATFTVTNSTVAAGNNRITAVAPTSFVAGHLGCIISLVNATNAYIGRIVEVTSSSAVRVEPTPQFNLAAGTGTVSALRDPAFFGSASDAGGRYGVSFQNRIVLGYTSTAPSSTISNGLGPEPNRLRWTNLTTEAVPQATYAGAFVYDGDTFLYLGSFLGDSTTEYFNYDDIPNLGGMTGLATVGDGQLLIFGPHKIFKFSGQLDTQTVQNNLVAFSIDQVANNVGIPRKTTQGIDDPSKSIQYAAGGLIFASSNDIYLYDGSSLKPLLQGRNARYYQKRLAAGDLIYGSAYSPVTNHYYLSMSGSDGGLLVNLDTYAMTRITNMQLFDCAPDPDNATKLWGARWWDTTGAAPTMTKGQLIQIDPIWSPTSANKNDADGTAVLHALQTKPILGGGLSTNKRPVDVQLTYSMRGTGSPTATLSADTKLDPADASYATITSTLPNTGTTSSVYGARILPLVAEGPAVEFKYVQNAACDSCEILSIDPGIQQDAIL